MVAESLEVITGDIPEGLVRMSVLDFHLNSNDLEEMGASQDGLRELALKKIANIIKSRKSGSNGLGYYLPITSVKISNIGGDKSYAYVIAEFFYKVPIQ